jgi:hypothetical protein
MRLDSPLVSSCCVCMSFVPNSGRNPLFIHILGGYAITKALGALVDGINLERGLAEVSRLNPVDSALFGIPFVNFC